MNHILLKFTKITFIALFAFAILFPITTHAASTNTIISNPVAGDLDGDGAVTSADYAWMKKKLLNQTPHFPIDARVISTINSINVNITTNAAFSLPTTVQAVMQDNSFRTLPITWINNTQAIDTSTAGEFNFYGFVEGYSSKVTLKLVVSNQVSTDKMLTYNLGSEPQSIDPVAINAIDGLNVINTAFEGLTRINEKMMSVPGVAKSWDISADGKTYTFHLRSNAKWSDGAPVTANDFYYAWTRNIKPGIESGFFYQMFYIKNAENYYNGHANLSDVGLKVIDPLTFEVVLAAPTPFFLDICAGGAFAPIRADIVEANPTGWASNPATYISNGPFKLAEWEHNSHMVFVKNTNYWKQENIKLDRMKWTMISSTDNYMSAWENGSLDIIENPPAAKLVQLKANGSLVEAPYLATYFLYFNMNKAPFNNLKFRKALSLVIDRNYITNTVLGTGQKPATAVVPAGIKESADVDFRATQPEYFVPEGNITLAKQLLTESGVNTSNLVIEYSYNTNPSHQNIALALKQMWEQNLGISITFKASDWTTFTAERAAGNFEIARSGWVADYADPINFLELFTSENGNNFGKYSNPNYDALIASARIEVNPITRMTMLHQAETMLIDDMAVIPLYFYVNNICVKSSVSGVYKTNLGIMNFDKVQIVP